MEDVDDLEAIEDEVGYQRFRILLENGRVPQAYRLFQERPNLVRHLPPIELLSAYEDLRTHVGQKEARGLLRRYRKEVGHISNVEIPAVELDIEKREKRELEGDLGKLNRRSRKRLEEMGGEGEK